VALVAALPADFPYAFVAKRELKNHVVSRLFLTGIGAIFVERFDAKQGIEDADQVAQALAGGRNPSIFPEGTFDRRPGLRAFRNGAFVIAAKANVPVVPVALRGLRSVLRGDDFFPHRGAASVWFGAPIAPAGTEWADAIALRDRVRAEMLKHCGEPDLAT
jgi:1-acyl-sn-glycerol-3-phosphate acyltransferase